MKEVQFFQCSFHPCSQGLFLTPPPLPSEERKRWEQGPGNEDVLIALDLIASVPHYFFNLEKASKKASLNTRAFKTDDMEQ